MSIYVIPTPSGSHITDALEKDSRIKLMYPEGHSKTREYVISGGETYCRLPDVEELQGEKVVVLHSGYSNPNDGLEFLRQILFILNDPTLADGTKLQPPSSIHLYMLTVPYAKQDGKWETGENNRAKQLMEELLPMCNLLVAVAPHFSTREWAQEMVENEQIKYILPYKLLLDAVEEDYPEEEFKHVSPGKFDRTGYPLIGTHRIEGLEVKLDAIDPEEYRSQSIILLDDITLTGNTLVEFDEKFHEIGVNKLILTLPHIATRYALERVLDSGYDMIYTTNSCDIFTEEDLENPRLKVLDLAPMILKSILEELD